MIESVDNSEADFATKILWQNILRGVFLEEDVIMAILECEIFAWQYVYFKENYD